MLQLTKEVEPLNFPKCGVTLAEFDETTIQDIMLLISDSYFH